MPVYFAGIRARHLMLGLAVFAALGAWGGYAVVRGMPAADDEPKAAVSEPGSPAIAVEVIAPRPGGIERICTQPGSVEPFECADLYAKVSGYLLEQKVDIGSIVKAGEILARIDAPEHEKQVQQDKADIVRAEAKVEQMKAAVTASEADLGTATASIALAQAEQKSKTSYREFREKQRDRIRDLLARNAIDAKLADEQEDQFQAAISAELAAAETVAVARQKESAARAHVGQARADLHVADAEVEMAKAKLAKSQVMLDYSIIRSPYTGVVTKRNFFPGDFIRSADAGGERTPMLAVERIDIMRVVIQVPERDVPFVAVGKPAMITVDALPGETFKTNGTDKVEVSRLADSEDLQTRMMRVEVDVRNPLGKLRRGMYGRATLILKQGTPNSLRVPSSALVGKANDGRGSVHVVRDSKAYLIPVRYGSDNGSEVEVLSGLTAKDRVIIQSSGTLEEGTPVAATEAKIR